MGVVGATKIVNPDYASFAAEISTHSTSKQPSVAWGNAFYGILMIECVVKQIFLMLNASGDFFWSHLQPV